VAPGTDTTLYEFTVKAQISELPFTIVGVFGMLFTTVIAKVLKGDDPQLLIAVTVIFPLTLPHVVTIELVVEVPVQLIGYAHV